MRSSRVRAKYNVHRDDEVSWKESELYYGYEASSRRM